MNGELVQEPGVMDAVVFPLSVVMAGNAWSGPITFISQNGADQALKRLRLEQE